MNQCPRCGTPAKDGDIYCGACGFYLHGDTGTVGVTQKTLDANDIRTNLGIVYFKLGKYAQAIEVFDKILSEDPDNLQVMDWRERALERRRSAVVTS